MGDESETTDAVRTAADATSEHLGRIASIVATAVRDIVVEIGRWADDIAAARTPVPEKPDEAKPAS
ncbi:hypothetical protein ALI144C_49845 [Actinosynnema sp. ALI-1.44]|uniref:hypothetical protein n=1 Tax=Actinosynnema sp. ALI-1.44 TaxID=1933779 RepID=UPI00097C36EA|nr:hypothetical protein [Actinosynnema sp. ALI-1.44]ONI70718.1 hypothetical protein ALI144C_49845 [Actinosynnema sp. ALI-1.44]